MDLIVTDLNSACKKLAIKYKLPPYFTLNPCNKPHHRFFLRFIKRVPRNSLILDGCCGIGTVAVCLKILGYRKYYGLDISKNYVEAGKELFNQFGVTGQLFCEDIKATRFSDSTFNIIAVLDASYFTTFDMESSVKEIHRILKPDGWFLMDVVEKKVHRWHHNIYSRNRMKELLNSFAQVNFQPLPGRPVKFMVVARKGKVIV